ncbi:site-specific integrase [Methylophilus sp. QUAN]|uniref:Site-specific integrase n=1 Tax=Methylophilus glucosoxydans TaxID=752553 RepID=A0ABW3GIB2_9PROT|nr:site-specific integrase [Methylophilus sp. QUAN]MBF4990746.1 site-specific integrase [Methylophilus sp. QUAN]
MNNSSNITPLDIEKFGKPPAATSGNPYAQIIWLFDKRASRAATKETRSTYMGAKRKLLIYLKEQHGNRPFILKEHIDEFFFVRLKKVTDLHGNVKSDLPKLASHTLVSFLSAVRQTLKEAFAQDLLSCHSILNANTKSGFRETNAHKDYSDKELEQILTAVNSEMRVVLRILAGYTSLKPGEGKDPRIKSETNPNARLNDPGHGWKIKANLQWYFENVMKGNASFLNQSEDSSKHKNFYFHASNTHGGIQNVYHSWGVTPFIGRNLIMPTVVNLIYLTGLNPDSLLNLSLDSYVDEHPLTNMPYIKFEKKRSGGEKELHLSLLDSLDEQPLKRKQAINVKKAFDTLVALTQTMRDGLQDECELKNRLIIYEAGSRKKYGEVIGLSSAQTSNWCREIVNKYDLRNDDGEPLEFNLVRFRSTKLTNMALSGRDLFEIQQVARHKSITTTLMYINKNRLDIPIRKVVSEALQRIRENRADYTNECSTKISTAPEYQPIKIYKGLVADCKNTYDPPDSVKRLQGYVQGSACTRFNMCLFCKNVILLKEHLPVLAAYRSQLLDLQNNNIQNLPNADHYDKTLELLEQLFDPDESEFDSDVLEWAVEMSETLDVVIDPLIYHGVTRD